MSKLKEVMDKVLLTTASILVVFLTAAALWQVFTRFVLSNPSVMTEEVARFSLIWVALLGAAYGFGSNTHISLDFLKEKLKGAAYQRLLTVIEVVILLFALFVLVIGGSIVVNATWTETSPIMGMSMGAVYSALPISGVCIILYQIINMTERKRVRVSE